MKCFATVSVMIAGSRVYNAISAHDRRDVTDFASAPRDSVTSRDRVAHASLFTPVRATRRLSRATRSFSSELSSPARSGLYHGSPALFAVVRLNCINDVVVVTDLDANSGVMHAHQPDRFHRCRFVFNIGEIYAKPCILGNICAIIMVHKMGPFCCAEY